MSNRDWWPNQPNLQVLHQFRAAWEQAASLRLRDGDTSVLVSPGETRSR
jgi:hypothetical protein